jgi:hypothetical protein
VTNVRTTVRWSAGIDAFTSIWIVAVGLGFGAGCGGGDRAQLPGAASTPGASTQGESKEAAIAQPMRAGAAPTTDEVEAGVDIPLKLTGIGSKQELDHALAKIQDPALRAEFERAFRVSFSHDKAMRRYDEAIPAMEKVLAAMPDFAPAYRVLAYAHFNTGGGMSKSTELYEKAVAADPEYGEAHYALSFMLTQSDMTRARSHFEKAMSMGIPDERNLREQFFQ